MALLERIEKEYVEALKGGKAQVVSTLRMLRAAIKNAEIDKMKKFEDPDIETVVRSEVKKLRETLETSRSAGRAELALKAEEELAILAAYLPQQLDEQSVRAVVAEKIASMGEVGQGDFGRVMGEVMKAVKGKADGALVSRIIKETLSKS